MIIYFADRAMSVLGHATTNLPNGYVIKEDLKTEDVNTGVASFSCYIGFTAENRAELEVMTNAGNYLLRSNGSENEFYTIIDSEIDTQRQEIYVYAEDAGLDLINEIADEFEAPESHAAEWYINKYIIDSGFEIGINEIPADTKRKLKWEGQATVTERLASIATQFGGYEIAFSFALKGLEITHKYVNIYKQRGQDNGVQLRLNKEVDKIITSRSVANLATAFICEGGVPDDADTPITLKGYSYDDGDFYVDTNGKLKSRKAVEKWSRYVWNKEPNKIDGYEGHIVRPYSYNTTSQAELCSHAIAELKKYCDMEVNYEANIKVLPAGVKIGDRVNIIDDAGGLYLSTRLLKFETSITEQKYTATLGEHLIKGSGISQKVADLAAEFAKTALSAARALTIANAAKEDADAANEQAEAAAEKAGEALAYATDADQMASDARVAADDALIAAAAAEAAVGRAEESVAEMDGKVKDASQAAQNAWNYADSVGQMASEAHDAAYRAEENAQNAFAAADNAGMYAGQATVAAEAAQTSAGEAKTQAQSASETATAAKAESKQALENVASLGTQLETLSQTMSAGYAKKTELTETTASLQTSISQNAAQISSNASALLVIDETANDAKAKAEAAQTAADKAQEAADAASEEAAAAQEDADEAAKAAAAAQSEADKANAAAAAAQKAADDADTELQTAKANLEAVTSRVGATEEEIEAAQKLVEEAQSAADDANAAAAEAAGKAAAAQSTADTAVTNAANAKDAADAAASKADAAQATANEAKGDASNAQTTATEAQNAAAAAQSTADTAVANAKTAQDTANAANALAEEAEEKAFTANYNATAAMNNLDKAKADLEAVKGRVDATEEDIAAAEEAVKKAQDAADQAAADAAAADALAEEAKANAANAQTAADNAQAAADKAQAEAEAAKEAADKAQEDADALAVRMVAAETAITQTSEAIALMATKTEIATTLGGYYTKDESDAAIQVKADEITQTVSSTYATKTQLSNVEGEAEAAQAAADDAQDAADALAIRVGTAETDIQQTKDSITSLASRTETVEGKFGNYYKKTEVDTKIQQSADSITQSVSSTYATIENMTAAKAEVVAQAAAAQEAANAADAKALAAQKAADDADKKAANAQKDLDTAEANLAEVTGRVGATEDEIAEAQAAVVAAQAKADTAFDDAAEAHTLAGTANAAAVAAQAAADAAQADADDLANRMTLAETKIEETAEAITLMATKTELAETLDGYYTADQTDAAIQLKADEITSSVSSTYATKLQMNNISVGGRNLAVGTSDEWVEIVGAPDTYLNPLTHTVNGVTADVHSVSDYGIKAGDYLTVSADFDTTGNTEMCGIQVRILSSTGSVYQSSPIGQIAVGNVARTYAQVRFTGISAYSAQIILRIPKGEVCKYKCLKIEKGNKATDWTPAPEDVDTAIGSAQAAADNAQGAVDALAIRVGTAETNIQQTQEAIALTATKEEVTESLTGYYTKTETDSKLQITSESITSYVSSTYATISDMNANKAEVVAAAAAAQATADAANGAAAKAAQDAKAADDKAAAAQRDLDTAEANLEAVTSRVGASEGEITAAKAAVEIAQGAADAAQAEAEAANAAADAAQAEAEAAREVADAAQEAADALADRMSTAETWIEETSEQITMFATKSEVEAVDGKFGNYYTAAQTNAKIQEKANEITLSVSSTYATTSSLLNVQDIAQEASQTANDAQTAAGQAAGSAESAYQAAQTASGKATTAQDAAEAADKRAVAAQVLASNAKTTADNAQADVDAIDVRVVQAEAKITAHDNAISLRATKTEVNEALGNYYTKDQTTAEIQLAANGITQSVSQTYTTKDELNNLEIGGRNLLPNSEAEISNDPEAENVSTLQYADLMPVFDKYGLGIFTLSFDIKAAVEGENKATVAVTCGEGVVGIKHTFPSRAISNISGEYVRHSFTFSPTISNPEGTNSMLRFASNVRLFVKKVKLEKGGKATDWTPAPEDVDEKIDGVSDRLADTNDRVEIAESTIRQLVDSISMLVTNADGTSLMTQTESGWTFSTGAIQEQIDNASTGLQDLQTEIGDTKSAVEILDAAVKDLGVLSEYIKIGTYTYTDDEGNEQTEPSIDLGETDTGFRLKITNTRILFTDGATNLVEINSKNKSLDIERARIKNELQMGGFMWKARSNGNLGLVWKGANS